MARLIEADALMKKWCASECKQKPNCEEDCAVYDAIMNEPTIDAVPVIRCAECYFWNKEPSQTAMPEVHTCRYWRIGTTCVDYCARASMDGWMKAMSKENGNETD